MNKYGNVLKNLKAALFFSIGLIAAILFIGGPIAICFVEGGGPHYIMLELISLPLGGFLLMQGIYMAFLNGSYESTGKVRDGNSTITPVKTLKYTKLSMWFCFLAFIAHIIIAILGIVFAIICDGDFRVINIITAVVAIILTGLYFLMAGKRKVNIEKNIDIEKDEK